MRDRQGPSLAGVEGRPRALDEAAGEANGGASSQECADVRPPPPITTALTMAFGIPIFVSRPSSLDERQTVVHDLIMEEVRAAGLAPVSIGSTSSGYGKSSYQTPLREVLVAAKHCCGGLVLGFRDRRRDDATPWNQIEGALMYGLGLPLLVFADPGVSSGVFDPGSHDMFVQPMPLPDGEIADLRNVIQTWAGHVRSRYYAV